MQVALSVSMGKQHMSVTYVAMKDIIRLMYLPMVESRP